MMSGVNGSMIARWHTSSVNTCGIHITVIFLAMHTLLHISSVVNTDPRVDTSGEDEGAEEADGTRHQPVYNAKKPTHEEVL